MSWVTIALLLGCYVLGTVLYRIFLSPLSKIPGPWMTCITSIPEANALKSQRRAQWVTDLFAQNPGSVAIRTGPKSVSFNHPDAVKVIYGKPNPWSWYRNSAAVQLSTSRSRQRSR